MTMKPEARPDRQRLVTRIAYDEFQTREGIPILPIVLLD